MGALVAGAALLAGCPGTIEDKTLFTGGGECKDIPEYFLAACTDGGCHGSMAPAAELDLKTPGVGTRLAGRAGKFCAGLLADPSTPEESVLYNKLTDAPSCGQRMPYGGTPLTDPELQCVLDWIATLQVSPSGGAGGGGGEGGAGGVGGAGGAGGAGGG